MQRVSGFLVVLVFCCALQKTSSQSLNVTVFTNLPDGVLEMGANGRDVRSSAVLACGTHADPSITLQHLWYIGDTRLSLTTPADRIFQLNGLVFHNSVRGTSLVLTRLSYRDAGQYRCESRGSRGAGESVSDSLTVTLELRVRLEPINDTVQTFNDSLQVMLGCDMAGYVRPDSDLHWLVDGRPVESLSNYQSKYSVSYTNGSRVAQNGGPMVVPSRVSWLAVFDIEMEDSNVEYLCAINGTDLVKDVKLVVERASAPSGPPTNITASATSSTSVRVEWSSVEESERNGNITHYEIKLSALDKSISVLVLFTNRSAEVQRLEEFTEYRATVRAFTVVGPGPYSAPPVVVMTPEDAPSLSPQILSLVSFNSSALGISWSPPPENHVNGILRHYVITACSPAATADIGSGSGSDMLNPQLDTCLTVNVTGEVTRHILTDLEEASWYQVTLAAVTIAESPSASECVQMRDGFINFRPGPLVTLGPQLVAPLVNLTCSIDLPTLTRNTTLLWQWRKIDASMSSSENRQEVSMVTNSLSSTLAIGNLSYSDSGEYECGVAYSEWSGITVNSSTVSLQLQFEIKAASSTVLLTEDHSLLHLECLLFGYTPSSELTWYHEAAVDGRSEPHRIITGIHHELDNNSQSQTGGILPGRGIKSVLSIPFPTESNAGRYLCALPNDLSANATIDVQFSPTETPSSENDSSGIVIVIVVVVLVVVIAMTTAGWCLFYKHKNQVSKSPDSQSSIDIHDKSLSMKEVSENPESKLSVSVSMGMSRPTQQSPDLDIPPSKDKELEGKQAPPVSGEINCPNTGYSVIA